MMKIEHTKIEGLFLVYGCYFPDLRGALVKPYSKFFFEEKPDLNLDFKETWFTKSYKGVIRAMHLQGGDYACEKLVSVIQGRIIDIVLDVRKGSETFGEWFECELDEDVPVSLYIPKGCAHGYKVMKDKSITMYMATEVNVPKDEIGIRWDSFGYDWKIENPIISERDKILPLFKDLI